jgi:hypothetical protein
MTLTKKQTRNLVARFWLFQGRLPAGTDNDTFDDVTMKDLELDDPPLPNAPDFEHQKYAELLTHDFNKLSIAVGGIIDVLTDDDKTMKDLWTYCYDNQKQIPGDAL